MSNLDLFKDGIAKQLGVDNYTSTNKKLIPAVINGYVGGNTTRLLNEMAQKIIMNSTEDEVRGMMDKYDLHPAQSDINESMELMSRFNIK